MQSSPARPARARTLAPMSVMPRRTPTLAPDERYLRAFDAERARVLRRRIVIYCGIALVLVGLSLIGTLTDFVNPHYHDGSPIRTQWMSLASDLLLAWSFLAAGVHVWRSKPDRRGLVRAVLVLTVAVSVFASAFELFTRRAEPDIATGAVSHSRAAFILARFAAADFLLFHGLASLLIPMRLREQVRLSMPCWAAFITVVLVAIPRPFTAVQAAFIAAFPALMVPGVMWSTWRYREFDARFAGREIAARFGEVAEELTYARRIHEALFPPEVDRGPVRVRYRYEPMREIGGDFLFVHPLAFPPSEHAGPVSVVLIDVSGHGVPAALAVNRLHGELQRLFALSPTPGPGDVIAALNRYTHAALSPQGVFATAFAAAIDPARGVVDWASAGHPPAFLRRATGGVEDLHSTAIMLGVQEPGEFDPAPQSLPIGPGDTILTYTDGAVESRREDSAEFTIPRLRDLVAAAPPGAALAPAAMDAVRSFRRGIADDTLIVEISLTPATAPASQPA
jgi:hypothetical protein